MIHAIIGGTNYAVNDVEVKYSLCKSSGTATFFINRAYVNDITTFEEVQLIADGESIFKGYVEEITYSAFPYRLQINCSSDFIKAQRTWFATEYISGGESVSHWAGVFFGLAQISPSVEAYSTGVYEGHSWGYTTCQEALTNLAQIVDARIYPDRNGTIHFRSLKTGGTDHTITYYINKQLSHSNASCRNKVVVFGVDVTAIAQGSNAYIIPGETRTAAISTGLIYTAATAQAVANKVLSIFNQPMSILTYVINGEPTLSLNDYIVTPDGSGAITSLEHVYNEDHFITTVTIGELCPNFFGLDIPPEEAYPYLYLSSAAHGVWKSDEEGIGWINISGTTLANANVPAIHWDGTYLWAISGNNIYRSVGGTSWVLCNVLSNYYVIKNEESYTILKENIRMVDIISDSVNSSRIFVVAYDEENYKTIVLFSENKYDFNRIILV